MKLLIIISSFIIVQAGKIEKDYNVVKIKDICYEKELLFDGLSSYPMAVDYASNTLYFSHGNYSVTSIAAKLNINTKEFEDIEGVGTGFTQAVDPKTRNVYFGGDHGIYKYDPNTNKSTLLGANDMNIWSIFFKDIIYYAIYPYQRVYTFADGNSTIFEDMKDIRADTFIIDNEDDMFYTNMTGLYSQKKGTKDAVLYRNFSEHEDDVGNGLTMDLNGNVYVCLDSGIFAVKKATKELEKLIDFEEYEGHGIVFDKDNNMIYGASTKMFRLKPNKDKTC